MTSLIAYIVIITIITSVVVAILNVSQRKHKQKSVIKAIQSKAIDVTPALSEVSKLFNYGHFITESERLDIEKKYANLLIELKYILNTKALDTLPNKNDIIRLHKVLSGTKQFKEENNEHFISKQLEIHKEFFDTVLPYSLDQQQREAIVSLEDNVLVISSAGSGKTMTTVGKVRYLVDKQGIDPKKILLITFTRKAAESLSQRLGEKDLKCVTFHKLALDIIAEATGEKPTLAQNDFPVQVYQELLKTDDSYKHAVTEYILRSRYKMRDQFEYSNMQEYMKDRKKYGVQASFTDMDGRPVFCKSDEESQICDFLGGRGIRFRYEERYEKLTYDKDHRQYIPDFSIYFTGNDGNERRVYLEHFAVNNQGRCPNWFTFGEQSTYLAGIQWKRTLHLQNDTTLIETSSADFHRGDVFDKLEKKLASLGVKFDYSKIHEKSRELAKQEQNVIDMLTSFMFLMKSKSMTINDVMSKGLFGRDRETIKHIIAPFVDRYVENSRKYGVIDFTDAIINATELCNYGHRSDYDYILVDEFQDISIDRYRFLQSLRRTEPPTKIFCVGDDWQSIYRFAGSDMSLFKSFSKYFGYTKECRMETTYRFGEPLIEKSSKFILSNPEQKEKIVKSIGPQVCTDIEFIPTFGKIDNSAKIKSIIDSIPVDKSIYILGRYSFDINILMANDFKVKNNHGKVSVSYADREMTYMTVHQSKGLESDYIILLNCNSGSLGFPADISDNPVLRYVLSEPDGYQFGEERRVFYVGITRAKKKTYVMYDQKHPSTFVAEFVDGIDNNLTEENIPDEELCPKCKCGRVHTVYKGIASNGNPFFLLGCTNEKLGCNYSETKFINLNKKH